MKSKKILISLLVATSFLTIDNISSKLNQKSTVLAITKAKKSKYNYKRHRKTTKNRKKKARKAKKKIVKKKRKTKANLFKNTNTDSNSKQNNNLPQLTDADVVGVWVNHINTDIHQQITFHSDHTWNENQHGVTNIYHGTWSITGKNRINLQPWNDDIVFSKNNFRKMTVVSFNHVLTKNK